MVPARDKENNTMSITKPHVIAASLVVAVGAAGLATMGVSQVGKPKAVQQASEPATKVTPADRAGSVERDAGGPADKTDRRAARSDVAGRNVHVEAPRTMVDVQKDTGKVRVKAPHTNVKVDPDKGQVRVRAPYVNLNIRW
jgi:hypothetical protein